MNTRPVDGISRTTQRVPASTGETDAARIIRSALPPLAGDVDFSVQARIAKGWARRVPQMVIAAETTRQRPATQRTPALELYEGSCFPWLRSRIAGSPPHRTRTFVLSARYGLVGANARLRPAPPLPPDAVNVKAIVRKSLYPYLLLCPVDEMLLLLPGPYLDLLPRVTGHVGVVHTVVAPVQDWPNAAAVLDRWGWP